MERPTITGSNQSQLGERRDKRKRDVKEDEWLVFGYEARLFRNDTEAQKVEDGFYRVPWNDDLTLSLDRYDVRHLVMDRATLDTSDENKFKDDKTYDEERYLDLDSEEELLFSMSSDERDTFVAEKKRSTHKVAYTFTDDNLDEQEKPAKEHKKRKRGGKKKTANPYSYSKDIIY
ncbi:hypothetical protein CLU79DRAFT_24082 [Phycomyces nitens]|nr:hypothetical protein CLU79DRAFT_24082 [Phycomyces nitens]